MKKTAERRKRKTEQWMAPVFQMTGTACVLIFLMSVSGSGTGAWYLFAAAAVLSLLLWQISLRRKKWMAPALLLLFGGTAALFFFLREPAVQGLEYIAGSIAGTAADTEAAAGTAAGSAAGTETAFLLILPALTVLLSVLLYGLHLFWPVYAAVTVLFLSGPLLGAEITTPSVFAMCVFQTVFWIRQTQAAGGRRNAGALALTAALFAAALVAVSANADWFYDRVYDAEGMLQRTVRRFDGNADSPASGTISRGNRYPAGEEKLEVWVTEEPSETLYLKGFSGGSYTDGEWLPNTDEELFDRMEEQYLHWGSWSDWIPGMYSSLYFSMNWMQNTEDEIRQMTVVELDRSETQWYQPYYGIWTNSGQLSLGAVGYEFRYYEQADMKPDWDQLSAEYESTGNSYRELKDAYMAVAQEAYTEFEAGETPRLAELCRENPQEDLSHVTSFILHTLNSRAEYTMTPGLFRFNQDPVEYFLFESGQGYCQHFASAAALMYRMYGVPARYAAGYVLSPSDFEQQENGLYRAVVTDEAAHAWPEIFLENYGWTPVEVTPSAAGEAARYPGFDSSVYDMIRSESGWSDSDGTQEEDAQADEQEEQAGGEQSGSGTDPAERILTSAGERIGNAVGKLIPDTVWGKVLLAAAALAALGAVLYVLHIRRAKRWERLLKNGGVRPVFGRMVELIHYAGILTDFDGQEEAFPQRLSEEIACISGEEAERLVRLVTEAAFARNGGENSGEDARAAEDVYRIYLSAGKEVIASLPRHRKIAARVRWPEISV